MSSPKIISAVNSATNRALLRCSEAIRARMHSWHWGIRSLNSSATAASSTSTTSVTLIPDRRGRLTSG
eukprot:scaffold23600_cov69-Phaeocystis_antarctica.AAC.2